MPCCCGTSSCPVPCKRPPWHGHLLALPGHPPGLRPRCCGSSLRPAFFLLVLRASRGRGVSPGAPPCPCALSTISTSYAQCYEAPYTADRAGGHILSSSRDAQAARKSASPHSPCKLQRTVQQMCERSGSAPCFPKLVIRLGGGWEQPRRRQQVRAAGWASPGCLLAKPHMHTGIVLSLDAHVPQQVGEGTTTLLVLPSWSHIFRL